MSAKAFLILCAQVLLVKSALSQCTSRAAVADISGLAAPCGLAGPYGLAAPALAAPYGVAAPAWAYDGLAYPGAGWAGRGLAYDGICGSALEFSPTSGGALPVSSASAIAPVGISVVSDNAYEGILAVVGELPFVGTTALEGVLPTAGSGAINHACGNGRNAMISENTAFAPAAYGPAAAIAPATALGIAAPFGYPTAGLGSRCGCGSNIGYIL